MYTIIDIETTGGSPKYDKITEVAVYVHNGQEVVEEYTSLVNPERPIPAYITALTGISNEMVARAPRFYEIARKLVELTEGKIFVAHNVSFDYSFIREEFRQLGFDFKRKQLCTVKLSRRLIPGLRSYSLGRLCKELDISIYNRHRAAGDAYATVKLFELLLSLDGADLSRPSLFRKQQYLNLHPMLSPEKIEAVPQATGVYYLLDEEGQILYIGKSKNLYSRVITHLQNISTRRSTEMRDRVADIDYELTGSELVALLKESYEIKKHKPLYNRKQRRTLYTHGIYSDLDEHGYRVFRIEKNQPGKLPLASFTSLEAARGYLEQVVRDHDLCQKLSGLYQGTGACFQYQVGICRGACIQEEPTGEYNARAEKLLDQSLFSQQSFFVLDEGRHEEERSVVKIEHGSYRGYGYIDLSQPVDGTDMLHECIQAYPDNRDVQVILKNYLREKKNLRILPF